jgi:NTE family protein
VDAIKIGEDATRKLADSLKRYSLPPEQYAALRSKQVAGPRPLGTVDEIRFVGLERSNPEVLRALVETKPGEQLSEEKLGHDLRRVFGRGDFETIGYRIGSDTGPRALIIEPREKSWGPDYLRFGLGLASDFEGTNQFNALVEYRKSWLNQLGGEWTTQAQIGQNTLLATEFYQPVVASGRWFVSPYASIGQQTRGVFAGDDKVADYLVKLAQVGIAGGAVLGTWGQFGIGPVWSHVKAEIDTGSKALPEGSETTSGIRARLFVDQMDHAFWPRDGIAATGSAYAALDSFGSTQSYQRLEGSFRWARSWGEHTVQLALAGGTDLGSDMPAYESLTLGGPLRLSGYRINQFAGRQMAFGRLMYYKRIFPLPDLLGSGVYAGASAEVGRVSDRFDNLPTPGTLWSGSLFLGADTFAGPAFLGVGAGGSGNWSLYMLLGAP